MYRNDKYFLEELNKSNDLYQIFCCIGSASTLREKNDEFDMFYAKEIRMEELLEFIKKSNIHKSSNVIQTYIDKLIAFGLCKYVTTQKVDIDFNNETDEKDQERLNIYKGLKLPSLETMLSLTEGAMFWGCSGISLYRKIIIDKENDEDDVASAKVIKKAFDVILNPYKEKIENLSSELEKKTSEINKTIDSGIIKNIQVLSVFAGIISLLFANIMGIKEFKSTGITGILILNVSTVMSIFSLLLFSKWIVVNEKVDKANFFASIAIIIILLIPIILTKL